MIETDIRELNERIQRESQFIDLINLEMSKVIVGQKHMTERLLIGLLSNGHILLEGVPGLAKTLAIKTLSSIIDADFSRIQFTPDLLPADLIGTMIYSQKICCNIMTCQLAFIAKDAQLQKIVIIKKRCL